MRIVSEVAMIFPFHIKNECIIRKFACVVNAMCEHNKMNEQQELGITVGSALRADREMVDGYRFEPLTRTADRHDRPRAVP